MFFIPMGLGLPFPRFPYASFLLLFVIIGFYNYGGSHEYSAGLKEISSEFDKGKELKKLYVEHCQQGASAGDEKKKCGKGIKDVNIQLYLEAPGLLKAAKLFDQSKQLAAFVKAFNEEPFSLRGYDQFVAKEQAAKDKLLSFQKKYHVASSHHLDAYSLIASVFHHGSWTHLIFNLIPLLLFGAYVEMRMGSLLFLSFFVTTGALSLMATLKVSNPEYGIVGASGGVFAVVGAFWALFFRHKLKILLFYIVVPVAVRLRTSWFIPVFFVGHEIVGFSIEVLLATNVAHSAHLAGFLVGAVYGYAIKKLIPLPADFVYEEELRFYKKNQLRGSLYLNPYNGTALLAVMQQGPRSIEIKRCFSLFIEKLDDKTVGELLLTLPFGEASSALSDSSYEKKLKIADELLRLGNYVGAFRLYADLTSGPNKRANTSKIFLTLSSLLEAMFHSSEAFPLGELVRESPHTLESYEKIRRAYEISQTLQEGE